jgi:hypothetical protein
MLVIDIMVDYVFYDIPKNIIAICLKTCPWVEYESLGNNLV